MHVFLAMSERLFFNKEKVKEKKSVSTCCNTQNLKQTDMYDSTPPPMYRLTASIYESSCKCSHLPSVVVSRNHTQVHKDTITWKHDKWPRSVVCRVLTVSLIHMNSCVNRIHTA